MRIRWDRVGALSRHNLRMLATDYAFVVVMTIAPLGFMAFSRKSFGLALQASEPGRIVDGGSFIVPAGAVLFSGFMIGNIGFWIFKEHGWGTWERLRAADLSTAELMIGKAVVPVLTLALQLLVLLGAGGLLFGMRVEGSWVAFAAVVVALVAAEVALGFLLLALCRSIMQLNAITNAGTMVLGGLGGAMAPVELLPGWAQAIAPIAPGYWAMRGFRSVTQEPGGLADVALPVAVLLGLAVVCIAIAIRRFDVESAKVSWA